MIQRFVRLAIFSGSLTVFLMFVGCQSSDNNVNAVTTTNSDTSLANAAADSTKND